MLLRVASLALKELIQLMRDRLMAGFILLFPVAQLVLLAAVTEKGVNHLGLAILDQDRSMQGCRCSGHRSRRCWPSGRVWAPPRSARPHAAWNDIKTARLVERCHKPDGLWIYLSRLAQRRRSSYFLIPRLA